MGPEQAGTFFLLNLIQNYITKHDSLCITGIWTQVV